MLLFDGRILRHPGVAEERRGNAPAAADVGEDRVPQLLELVCLHRIRFDRDELGLSRQDGRAAAVGGAAVERPDLFAEGVDRLLRDLLLGLQDNVGPRGVLPETRRRGVEFTGEGDRRPAEFSRRHADRAIVRQPSPVHHLRGRHRFPNAAVIPELVGERVVGQTFDLHPRRVHGPQLRTEAARPRQDAAVGVSVEGRPVADQLPEVVGRLPRVRPLPQRVGAGEVRVLLPSVWQRPHHLERHDRHGLRDPADDPEDRRHADRGLGADVARRQAQADVGQALPQVDERPADRPRGGGLSSRGGGRLAGHRRTLGRQRSTPCLPPVSAPRVCPVKFQRTWIFQSSSLPVSASSVEASARALTSAAIPSIFSLDFALSGLIMPVGSV